MRAIGAIMPVIIGAVLVALALGCGQPARLEGAAAPEEIALPAPSTKGGVSVEEAIARRRSIRQFADRELSLTEMGQLAWAAQGITEPSRGLRAAPSAGATYPMELYLATREGLFHYQPVGHRLAKVASGDVRPALSGQPAVRQAPVTFVLAAVYERTRSRYGERAERYVHIEAGHIAENLHLQAVALGLASVPVGAFDDAAVARALNLPADQAPIYMVPVGHPRG